MDFDENEPTGLVFHGRKERNLGKGFRLGGYPSGKTRKGKKKDLPGGFPVEINLGKKGTKITRGVRGSRKSSNLSRRKEKQWREGA